jgi:hypothetical protein
MFMLQRIAEINHVYMEWIVNATAEKKTIKMTRDRIL